MDNEQIEKYSMLKGEIDKLNVRQLKKETRTNYKNRTLKFLEILIENNIEISAFRNLKNKHIMIYGELELGKGRSVNAVMQDIVAVKFFFNFQQNSNHIGKSRKLYLLDNKVLKKYFIEVLEGGDKVERI